MTYPETPEAFPGNAHISTLSEDIAEQPGCQGENAGKSETYVKAETLYPTREHAVMRLPEAMCRTEKF